MNISPLNPVAASIAGTDRAASSGAAQVARNDSPSPTSISGMVEKTEQVIKGDPAGDSTADGRQLLDSFERHPRDEDDEANAEGDRETSDGLNLDLQNSSSDAPPPAVRFDIQA